MIQNKINTLWVEKYRPKDKSLNGYIANENLREKFLSYIESKDVPHLLLSGRAGTGKTTIAKIIASAVAPEDTMYINASSENSVDVVREKIIDYAQHSSFGDGLKVIVLDEADRLTPQAQGALRNAMERYSKYTRMIFTCNNPERIIEPLSSRCVSFQVETPDKESVAIRVGQILVAEKIKYDVPEIVNLVNAYYPDIRKIINMAQNFSVSGKLLVVDEKVATMDSFEQVISIIGSNEPTADLIKSIRKLFAGGGIRTFDGYYTRLYENLENYCKNDVQYINCVGYINFGQYADSFVLDKEICAMDTTLKIINEIRK